jgi:4-amino-4-deoxy-L-arabinose transferase-like glycosyltransferase
MWAKIKQHPALALILLVSVGLRVAAALYLGNTVAELPGIADQISYQDLAVRLLGGHGFTHDRFWWPWVRPGEPTAHWSYLYILYLAGVYALAGVQPIAARLVQAALAGVLQPWLAYRLGSRIFGRRTGLVAAGITAIYIYFVYYAAALMTEVFYITAILSGFEIAFILADGQPAPRRGRLALGLGLSLGAALLLRQVYLLFVPFLFGWLLWAGGRSQLRNVLTAGAVMTACILPATLFNYTQFGRFVLLNTNAGFAFFWGNHPVYGDTFVSILPGKGAYQSLIPEELRGLDEAALDQELLRRGIGFITSDPRRYLMLCLTRIPAYFEFWYARDSGLVSNLARMGSFGVFLPFMIGGLAVAFPRRWREPAALLVMFALVYTGIHILTWGLVRYRLPVDAVLILFAAAALLRLWDGPARAAGG